MTPEQKEKKRRSNQKWVANNAEKERERKRRWAQANPEKVREYARRHYQKKKLGPIGMAMLINQTLRGLPATIPVSGIKKE